MAWGVSCVLADKEDPAIPVISGHQGSTIFVQGLQSGAVLMG